MEYHELDPNGDLVLVLQHQNMQSFPWALDEPDDQLMEWTASALGDLDSVRFKVSSKHLILASPVFKAMLCGHWKESILLTKMGRTQDTRTSNSQDGALPEITTTQWDKRAFLILLNIFHGRNHSVPVRVDLHVLVNISIMVDYYKCHDSTAFFASLWMAHLRDTLHVSYG
ncbi:hypothetical protein E4U43_001322 [Claviceps pusilla]|uniref:BTB domain-containing protein n=1 Tax=Claviceps pusilla TaxID=123648 RepID=A0A9P7SZD3_9HYPO|nr:hypothetical protein E4U43_001322 [Claviceps pusilla]